MNSRVIHFSEQSMLSVSSNALLSEWIAIRVLHSYFLIIRLRGSQLLLKFERSEMESWFNSHTYTKIYNSRISQEHSVWNYYNSIL